MSHYEARKKAEEYIRMAEGYDGAEMIEKLRKFLPKGVKVLELGMGPGTDLLDLGTRFEVVGSDASQSFLDIFTEKHPEQGIRLMQLDAVTIETDERFDGIYSNKVLQYFDEVDLKASFVRQAEVLNAGGVVLHTFWRGTQVEEFNGVKFYYYMEEVVKKMVEDLFDVMEMGRYAEFEDGDSFYLILRKK